MSRLAFSEETPGRVGNLKANGIHKRIEASCIQFQIDRIYGLEFNINSLTNTIFLAAPSINIPETRLQL